MDIGAIVLAGGLGYRLGECEPDPKPLVRVGSRMLIEYTLFPLFEAGIRNCIISVGYRGNEIQERIGNGSRYGMHIDYIADPIPLDDAGALKYCFPRQAQQAILANADEIRLGLDVRNLIEKHLDNNAIGTVALIESDTPSQHGIFEMEGQTVLQFFMHPSPLETSSVLANTGLYVLAKEVLTDIPDGRARMEHVLPSLVSTGRMRGFCYQGRYWNVGTPEILEEVRRIFI
jgi:mannose-1-phosphate guanylyltransferase